MYSCILGDSMVTWLIKLYMNIVEFLGRLFILNRNFPCGIKSRRNIRYSETGILDVFMPAEVTGKSPVLVYIHGGGWVTGSRRSCRRICAVFAAEGYVVLNLKYRLSPGYSHPAALHDIDDSIGWLYENAGDISADTNRIFFGGSSAGAHLSCMTACIATNDELRKITGVNLNIDKNQLMGTILVYGGYNMRTILDSGFFMIRTMVNAYTGGASAEDEIWNQISPVDHITEDFPPAFITVGERDHLYGQSVELIEVLNQKGLSYEKLLFNWNIKEAKHGFFHFYNRECTREAYKGIIAFMNEQAGVKNVISSNK
jgi:acetyl esterase/lipase